MNEHEKTQRLRKRTELSADSFESENPKGILEKYSQGGSLDLRNVSKTEIETFADYAEKHWSENEFNNKRAEVLEELIGQNAIDPDVARGMVQDIKEEDRQKVADYLLNNSDDIKYVGVFDEIFAYLSKEEKIETVNDDTRQYDALVRKRKEVNNSRFSFINVGSDEEIKEGIEARKRKIAELISKLQTAEDFIQRSDIEINTRNNLNDLLDEQELLLNITVDELIHKNSFRTQVDKNVVALIDEVDEEIEVFNNAYNKTKQDFLSLYYPRFTNEQDALQLFKRVESLDNPDSLPEGVKSILEPLVRSGDPVLIPFAELLLKGKKELIDLFKVEFIEFFGNVNRYYTDEEQERINEIEKLLGKSVDERLANIWPSDLVVEFEDISDTAILRGSRERVDRYENGLEFLGLDKKSFIKGLAFKRCPIFGILEQLNVDVDELKDVIKEVHDVEDMVTVQNSAMDLRSALEWGEKRGKREEIEEIYLNERIFTTTINGGYSDNGSLIVRLEEYKELLSKKGFDRFIDTLTKLSPRVWIHRLDYVIENDFLTVENVFDALDDSGDILTYLPTILHQLSSFPDLFGANEKKMLKERVLNCIKLAPWLFLKNIEYIQNTGFMSEEEINEYKDKYIFGDNERNLEVTLEEASEYSKDVRKDYIRRVKQEAINKPEIFNNIPVYVRYLVPLLEDMSDDELMKIVKNRNSDRLFNMLFSNRHIAERLLEHINAEQFKDIASGINMKELVDIVENGKIKLNLNKPHPILKYNHVLEKIVLESIDTNLDDFASSVEKIVSIIPGADKKFTENAEFILNANELGFATTLNNLTDKKKAAELYGRFQRRLVFIEGTYDDYAINHLNLVHAWYIERNEELPIPYPNPLDPIRYSGVSGNDVDVHRMVYDALSLRIPVLDSRLRAIVEKKESGKIQDDFDTAKIDPEFIQLVKEAVMLNSSPLLLNDNYRLSDGEREDIAPLISLAGRLGLDENLEVSFSEDGFQNVKEKLEHEIVEFLKEKLDLQDVDSSILRFVSADTIGKMITYSDKKVNKHEYLQEPMRDFIRHLSNGDYLHWRAWGSGYPQDNNERDEYINKMKEDGLIPSGIDGDVYEKWVGNVFLKTSEMAEVRLADIRLAVLDRLKNAIADKHIEPQYVSKLGVSEELEYKIIVEPTVVLTQEMREIKAIGVLRRKEKGKSSGWRKALEPFELSRYNELMGQVAKHRTDNGSKIDMLMARQYLNGILNISLPELNGEYINIGGKHIKLKKAFGVMIKVFGEHSEEFARDLDSMHALLKESKVNEKDSGKAQSLFVTDEVDAETYFSIGENPVASCQSWNRGSFNQGLLSFMVDPAVKILQVRDKDGYLIARSVMRLLSDKEGNPQLFIERVYTDYVQGSVRKAVHDAAKEKAKEMGIGVFGAEDGGDRLELHSSGSRAGVVYTDSGGGSMKDGKFTINNARSL